MTRIPNRSRLTALALAASVALPMLSVTAGCGSKNSDNVQVSTNAAPISSKTQPSAWPHKMILLKGPTLLFYLYHRSLVQFPSDAPQHFKMAALVGKRYLYQKDSGPNKDALYYRKIGTGHAVVWLQVQSQGMEVPDFLVRLYLPDYGANPNAYQGQVNAHPQPGIDGGTVESAEQYMGRADSGAPSGSYPGGGD